MSVEQRVAAQVRQAELDRAEAQAREAEARARIARETARLAELDRLRREARYGERVQCVLDQAEVHLGGKWYGVEPVALDLVKAVRVPFEVVERKLRNPYRTSGNEAFFDGQIVTLCPDVAAFGAPDACLRLVGTTSDYRVGLSRVVESHRFLRGQLRCKLAHTRR
jgi:hypothetical protein